MLVEHNIHRICNDLFISEYVGFTTESTAGYVFTSIKVVELMKKPLDCAGLCVSHWMQCIWLIFIQFRRNCWLVLTLWIWWIVCICEGSAGMW